MCDCFGTMWLFEYLEDFASKVAIPVLAFDFCLYFEKESCITQFFKNNKKWCARWLKKNQALILLKSFAYPNSHIFERPKRVWLFGDTTVIKKFHSQNLISKFIWLLKKYWRISTPHELNLLVYAIKIVVFRMSGRIYLYIFKITEYRKWKKGSVIFLS